MVSWSDSHEWVTRHSLPPAYLVMLKSDAVCSVRDPTANTRDGGSGTVTPTSVCSWKNIKHIWLYLFCVPTLYWGICWYCNMNSTQTSSRFSSKADSATWIRVQVVYWGYDK